MRASVDARHLLAEGLRRLRDELGVPVGFPPEVLEEVACVVAHPPAFDDHADATDLPLVTLDPLGSMDLDQAFCLEAEGDDLVLSYAIADVGAWLARGGAVEAEAWRRGTSLYLLDGKVPLHPPELSEAAASLLPGGARPAVVLTVVVDLDGEPTLRSARRAMVRSRGQLAYETATEAQLPPLLAEFAARLAAAEDRRGASRVDFPDQEVVAAPGSPSGYTLRARPRLASEDRNAYLSLSANLAAGAAMHRAGLGLFRTMPEPDSRHLRSLRRSAAALGIAWPDGATLRQVHADLDQANPAHVAFLLAARRGGQGATYATYRPGGPKPWHAVIAGTYAHATAPLRRLADRYVLDVLCQLDGGDRPTADELATLDRLPEVMEGAETVAARADRATVDLVEAVLLEGREGEVFGATAVDVDDDLVLVQLDEPAVRTRVRLTGAEPGQRVRLRLVAADPQRRRVELEAE